MCNVLFKFLLLSITIKFSFAQNINIISSCKSRFVIDKRPKKYLIKNKLSRDTLLLNFNLGLSNGFKEEKYNPEFVNLNTEKQKEFEQLALFTKKVVVKPSERKAPSKYAFFRFFRKKNKKDKVFFLKPQQVLSENASLFGGNYLVIINRLRIDNKWALNFDFRNRTILRADYTIYNKEGLAQTYYRTKIVFNMQKDIKLEAFLHFQRKLGELCALSIVSDLETKTQ